MVEPHPVSGVERSERPAGEGPPSPRRPMRKYTLFFSIVAHAIAVAAVIIVPALATDNLPEPRRTSALIIVRPELPQPAPLTRRSRSQTPLLPAPVPLAPPESVQQETIAAPH